MRKYLFISALLGGPLLWTSAVQAAPCVSATYDVYLASGFSCTVGDQTYSGFSLDAPANVNASSITVGPAPNAPAGNFGLLFNTSNVVSAPPGTDMTLDFTVTATNALINDASVTITGSTSGDGNIELTECLSAPDCSAGTLKVQIPGSGGVGSTAHTTFPPTSSLYVTKDTVAFAGLGTATLDTIEELFSEEVTPPIPPSPPSGETAVPEPASLVLLGSALIGFVATRRRKRV